MSHFTSSDKFLKWNSVVSTVAYRKLAEIKKTLWYWWHVAPYCIHSGCHNLLQFVTTELLFVCLSVRLRGRSALQLLKSLLKLNVVRNDKKKNKKELQKKNEIIRNILLFLMNSCEGTHTRVERGVIIQSFCATNSGIAYGMLLSLHFRWLYNSNVEYGMSHECQLFHGKCSNFPSDINDCHHYGSRRFGAMSEKEDLPEDIHYH